MIEGPITYNGLTLNDWVNRNITASPYGWYKVTSIDGLWDAPVRFQAIDLPGRSGAHSGDAFYSGKTIVIAGVIKAATIGVARDMQLAIQQAFDDMLPHDLGFVTMSGLTNDIIPLTVTCRKNQQIDMVISQDQLEVRAPFTIQLFADDPTIFISGTTDAFVAY